MQPLVKQLVFLASQAGLNLHATLGAFPCNGWQHDCRGHQVFEQRVAPSHAKLGPQEPPHEPEVCAHLQ